MQTNLSEVQNPEVQNPPFEAVGSDPSIIGAEPVETSGTDKKANFNEPSIYQPHWITGGAKHPGLIVETPGLANVAPPPITYRPTLPHRLSDLNLISAVQFERVIYAGQSHEQKLGNGARAGISIGDGTGAGKTSSLAGIILDNWFRGRRKTIWFSVKTDLIEAVREEFERLRCKIPIRLINDYTPEQNILLREGIIFCTYKSLIAKSKTGERRVDQIMRWLGENGLEIFDEGHRAKHAFADENGKATQTGAAVLEVQYPVKYPDIRVVYSSATAASEVRHLAYQIRLGLWGTGTSFPLGFPQFAEEIESGGVGAMEMVARDLKAMGRYFCGNLSYGIDPDSGLAVEYREVIHPLTPKQREMYNNMARGWIEVLKNFNRALDITNSSKISRRYAIGQFWAEHQRCFRNLITAFKVPTIIREIETALAERQSIVVSITGTGEAQTKKQISRAIDDEEPIETLDFSPRETLSRLVENCFPTKVFQEQTDTNSGTLVYVPVLDDQGQQLESRVALELKKELLDRLSLLEIPEHPLDQLVNYFGTENVAEMTGRKKRLIKTLSGRFEYRARQIPGVPNRLINLHEKELFPEQGQAHCDHVGGRFHRRFTARQPQSAKSAAALSHCGGTEMVSRQTGAGLRANSSHRSGGAADLRSRFYRARRRSQVFSHNCPPPRNSRGTHQRRRRAEKAGNLDKYNLESREGKAALNVVFTRILNGEEIIGLENPKQTLIDMGLLKDGSGQSEITPSEITPAERTNIPRFLNRLLSLEVERQNALFDYFHQTFLETIEHLKAKGRIDDGMEDLKALSVRMPEPPQILYTDALTGANTVYYKLEITVPTRPAKFEEISQFDGVYFYENRGREEFIAVRQRPAHTDPETGERYQMVSISRPAGLNLQYTREDELDSRHKIVPKARARTWWQDEQAKIPPTKQKTVHLLSGALLPIWKNLKKLQQTGLNIVRTTTDNGIRLVGVNIAHDTIKEIRRAFGIWQCAAGTAEEIIRSVRDENEIIELLGDIRIRRTRFQGLIVIEVCPGSYEQIRELRETALINIVQNSRSRFFLSENESHALETLEKLLKAYPPLYLLKNACNGNYAQNTPVLTDNQTPVSLPDWLVEPPSGEVERLSIKNLGLSQIIHFKYYRGQNEKESIRQRQTKQTN